MPSTPVCRPGGVFDRYTFCISDRKRMSFTSVDLPDPDTPVTATKQPSGNATSMFLRLFCRAPRTVSHLSPVGRRCAGTGIDRLPARYCPVTDLRLRSSPLTVPVWTISPPCSPAPGPMSTTWSATMIVSSSCSTTRTVLPSSRRRMSVSMSRRLSRWCSPIDGSSSTYSTPTRPDPICEARRMRCASPPASVPAERDRVR